MKPRKTKPTAVPGGNKNILLLPGRAGVSAERQLADLATDGIASNAMTAQHFLAHSQPNLSITEMVQSLQDHGERVNGNDLAAAERMLTAQAIALDTIFSEMARRSAMNLGQYLDASERYMRMALKAQGQCRATVEALAAIKNPPVVFAKQANIAHGPQQVNNGVAQVQQERDCKPAHAKQKTVTNELLGVEDGKRLDSRAQEPTSLANPRVATVEEVHRAKVVRGASKGSAKQL